MRCALVSGPDFITDRVDECARESFEDHGLICVRNLLPRTLIERLERTLRQLIAAQFRATGYADPTADGLDAAFNELCARNRSLGGHVYEAGRRSAALFAVLCAEPVLDAVATLLGSDAIVLPPKHVMLRIDRRGEGKFAFPWHQDYPFNLMSRPTVTIWAPLTPVAEEMGRLQLVPGSHRQYHRVKVEDDNRFVTFADLDDEALDARAVSVDMAPGDALLFHDLLIHRSGHNVSDRARWTINARYGDANDLEFASRGWRYRQQAGFAETNALHPGSVLEQPSPRPSGRAA